MNVKTSPVTHPSAIVEVLTGFLLATNLMVDQLAA